MELFFVWILFAILGAAMLSRYNRAGTGLLLGLLLGPFGLLFALVIRSGESKKEEQKRHEEQLQEIRKTGEADEEARKAKKGREVRIERECPFCAEKILIKAKVCRFCGKEVDFSNG